MSTRLRAALVPRVIMKRYNRPLMYVVGEPHSRAGARKIVGLDWHPSKSWLHKRLRRLPPYELILRTAGEDAFGAFSVDSPHHRHVLTENAKHGRFGCTTR